MKKFKTILLVLAGFIVLFLALKTFRNISAVDKVTELKTSHFVISYHGIYDDEARDVAKRLEEDYDRIRTDLKDPAHETIRVFIYPTRTNFNKGTGMPNSTANGTSRGPNEFHIVWTTWFNSIFPDDPIKTSVHEFTHCIQLNILISEAQKDWSNSDSVNFDKVFEEKFSNKYPQWFWEALCDYEAGIVNKLSVNYGMRKNLDLKELNKSNQIYNVGYTIVEYIVAKWGKEKLPELITSYVDLQGVLKVSEEEFEKGWVDFVKVKY